MNNEQFLIERTFNAPRELVYLAWTQADSLAQWWGPKGFKITVARFEFSPGGVFHYSMTADNGAEMWGRFTFEEMLHPERIVFISSFSDKEGNKTRGPFFDGKWPLEIRNVLTLTEDDGKTKLTLKGAPVNATPQEIALYESMAGSMQQGFKGTFDQLEAYLSTLSKQAGMPENKKVLTLTRLLDAPQELVFKAWTDPEHMMQWWGPKGFTIPVCELDVKPGGAIRLMMDSPTFPGHWMGGEFVEIIEPERLVFIARAFQDENGNFGLETLNTISFETVNGKTQLTVHVELQRLLPELSFAADGMNDGWSQSLDKLAELLATIKKN